MGVRSGVWVIAGLALGLSAVPASAETLTISGYNPAASDAALEVQTIAVDRLRGVDGPRLALLASDRLRSASINGERWFTVLAASRADEADAVLEGFVEPRFSEQRFKEKREICWTEDAEGDCIEEREVELDCLRVTVSLRPELRLIARDGELLWANPMEESRQASFCPDFDDAPDADPLIDAMLESIAARLQGQFVPSFYRTTFRIMESRRGLEGDARDAFRDAVRLTKSDEDAACREFERLHGAYPDHDSLTFNVGLCAERDGRVDDAQAFYRQALASDRSDDEAQMGLSRIERSLLGEEQLQLHFGL